MDGYGGRMATLIDELVRLLRLEGTAEQLGPGNVVWQPTPDAAPVILLTTERELSDAVHHLGREKDALWPTATTEQAGFNLLLVHLDEVLATRTVSGPLRITSEGLQWPS